MAEKPPTPLIADRTDKWRNFKSAIPRLIESNLTDCRGLIKDPRGEILENRMVIVVLNLTKKRRKAYGNFRKPGNEPGSNNTCLR